MPLLGTFGASSGRGFGQNGNTGWDGSAEYLIVAGGGGGAGNSAPASAAGGGGAGGGYRTSFPGLVGVSLTLAEGGSYTITVGGGGAKSDSPNSNSQGARGDDSSISHPTITDIVATGGGGGGAVYASGLPGGSGGGGGNAPNSSSTTGTGNTPPVAATPVMPGGQGYPGGSPATNYESMALPGGGAGGAGSAAEPNQTGGIGLNNSITGTSVGYAGGGGGGGASWAGHRGGGGGGEPNTNGVKGFGGGHAGGAGNPSYSLHAVDGDVNTGGGGGGGSAIVSSPSASPSASGGSGIVVIRTPGDVNLGASPGTNTVTTLPSGDKVATFTVSGTLTT